MHAVARLALLAAQRTCRKFTAGDGKRIAKLPRKHPQLFNREPLSELRGVAATLEGVPAPARED